MDVDFVINSFIHSQGLAVLSMAKAKKLRTIFKPHFSFVMVP